MVGGGPPLAGERGREGGGRACRVTYVPCLCVAAFLNLRERLAACWCARTRLLSLAIERIFSRVVVRPSGGTRAPRIRAPTLASPPCVYTLDSLFFHRPPSGVLVRARVLVHVVRVARSPCMRLCVQYTPLTAVNAPNFRGVFTFAMFMTAKRCQRVETPGESGSTAPTDFDGCAIQFRRNFGTHRP